MMKNLKKRLSFCIFALAVSVTPVSASDLTLSCKLKKICQKGTCREGVEAEKIGDVKISIPLATPKEIKVEMAGQKMLFTKLGTNGVYLEKSDLNFLLLFEFVEHGGSFSIQRVRSAGSDWLSDDGFAAMRMTGKCSKTGVSE